MTNPVEELEDAYTQACRAKDWPAALRQGQLAAELAPNRVDGWVWMAEALHNWGKHDQALAAIDKALAIDPASGECYEMKGHIAMALGNETLSLGAFRNAYECSSTRGWAYMEALAHFKQYEAARARYKEERARFQPDEDTSGIDAFGINLDMDEVLDRHWHRVEVKGEPPGWIPLNHAAVDAMQRVLTRARALDCKDPRAQERLREQREVIADQISRRYGGGCLVPSATALLGALLLWWGIDSGEWTTIGGGVFYLACVPVYLHAARVQTYRLNARNFKGEKGAGDRFAALVAGMNPESRLGCAGIWLSFAGLPCLAAFSPVIILYHYVRNYVFK